MERGELTTGTVVEVAQRMKVTRQWVSHQLDAGNTEVWDMVIEVEREKRIKLKAAKQKLAALDEEFADPI
jgi:hypothetical protein